MAVYWDSDLHMLVDDDGQQFENNRGRPCAVPEFEEDVPHSKNGPDFWDGVMLTSAVADMAQRRAKTRMMKQQAIPSTDTPRHDESKLKTLTHGVIACTSLLMIVGSLLASIIDGHNVFSSIVILLVVIGSMLKVKDVI